MAPVINASINPDVFAIKLTNEYTFHKYWKPDKSRAVFIVLTTSAPFKAWAPTSKHIIENKSHPMENMKGINSAGKIWAGKHILI